MKINNKRTKLPSYIHVRKSTPLPLAKQYVGRKCPLCGSILSLKDSYEVLCPDCGCVESDNNLVGIDYNSSSKQKFHQKNLTKFETKFLKHSHFNDRKERRRLDYKMIVDTLKFDLCLTTTDVQDVFRIIDQIDSLKQLHTRLPYDTIIAGICRYVIKKRGILPGVLRFSNNAYKEYKLSKHDYKIIERNIEKLIT